MDRKLVYNDELTASKWALNSAVECNLHTLTIDSRPLTIKRLDKVIKRTYVEIPIYFAGIWYAFGTVGVRGQDNGGVRSPTKTIP